jgi:hypothetical protein
MGKDLDMARNTPPGTVMHHGKPLSSEGIAALMAESMGWNPQDGDELRGKVLGAKMAYSDVSEKDYPIVFVLLPEGELLKDEEGNGHDIIAIHGFAKSLQDEMYSQRPEQGDDIYVKKIGERGKAKRKGWNAPVIFAVVVTKPSGKVASVWDNPRAAVAPEPAAQGRFSDEPPF